jgi:hypothetical protein
MFDTITRSEALSAIPTHGRDARELVEATLRNLLLDRLDVLAIRWEQTIDDPDPEVFVVSRVVAEFTNGATYDFDTATAHGPSDLDLTAYAVLADLVVAQSDLLVAAFGLGVSVRATRVGVEVTPRAS